MILNHQLLLIYLEFVTEKTGCLQSITNKHQTVISSYEQAPLISLSNRQTGTLGRGLVKRSLYF